MPNITARKHITNTSAGVGFSWRTGRYVVPSHPATAAPDNFDIPSRSRLGEKRPKGRGCAPPAGPRRQRRSAGGGTAACDRRGDGLCPTAGDRRLCCPVGTSCPSSRRAWDSGGKRRGSAPPPFVALERGGRKTSCAPYTAIASGFADDSPLEQARFEPSVPLDSRRQNRECRLEYKVRNRDPG
jgi:hypothetical protein